MAAEAPDPLEVSDFKFRELKHIPVSPDVNWFPQNAVNLVASSSRFGLIFVGYQNGFKVFSLEDVLDLNEEKISLADLNENRCTIIHLQAEPTCLSLSCDEMTLAVCIVRGGCPHVDMYDIRVFAEKPCSPSSFTTVQLSSVPGTQLLEFAWNPSIPGIFASCTSDGSILAFEQTDTSLKILGSLPAIGATCICWSPKGKQLVAGKKDGSMSQYKPSLQEAKQIPPPNIFENAVSVLNVLWLQTTQFAAIYVPAGSNNDSTPYFILVSLSKGAPPVYVNYNDICLGAGDMMNSRYMMLHIPEWNVLVCASRNSVETAVMGCIDEKSHWIQWLPEGTGRADLPVIKDQETYPLGMSMVFSAQRTIIINESESHPPMPIMFLLSTAGILCPFHVINAFPNAPSLIQPPEVLLPDGARKSKNTPVSSSMPSLQPSLTSTPIVPKSKPIPDQAGQKDLPLKSNLFGQMGNTDKSFQVIPSHSMPMQPSIMTGTLKNQTAAVSSDQTSNITGSMPFNFSIPKATQFAEAPIIQSKPQPQVAPSVAPTSKPSIQSTQAEAIAGGGQATYSIATKKETSPGSEKSTTEFKRATEKESLVSADLSAKSDLARQEDTYISEAINEMRAFQEELNEIKQLSLRLKSQVGTPEEMKALREKSKNMNSFHQELKKTMVSINSDVHTLKNYILESFAMLEEARSRFERNRDPRYVNLLRGRALDPITARTLQEMRRREQYLEIQMVEINRKLDQEWQELSEMKKKRDRRRTYLPSEEVIYRTLLNNNKLIFSLAEQLDQLSSELKELKSEVKWQGLQLSSVVAEKSATADELSALADMLLETKLEVPPKEVEHPLPKIKVMPLHKRNNLREALMHRPIHSIRAPMASVKRSYISAVEMLKEKMKERTRHAEASTAAVIEKTQLNIIEQPNPILQGSTATEVSNIGKLPEATAAFPEMVTANAPTEVASSQVPIKIAMLPSKVDIQEKAQEKPIPEKPLFQPAFGFQPNASSKSLFQTSVDSPDKLGLPFVSSTPVSSHTKPSLFPTNFGPGYSSLPQNKFSFLSEVAKNTTTSGRENTLSSAVYENITPPSTPQPVMSEIVPEDQPINPPVNEPEVILTTEPQKVEIKVEKGNAAVLKEPSSTVSTPVTILPFAATTKTTAAEIMKASDDKVKLAQSGFQGLSGLPNYADTPPKTAFQMPVPTMAKKDIAKELKDDYEDTNAVGSTPSIAVTIGSEEDKDSEPVNASISNLKVAGDTVTSLPSIFGSKTAVLPSSKANLESTSTVPESQLSGFVFKPANTASVITTAVTSPPTTFTSAPTTASSLPEEKSEASGSQPTTIVITEPTQDPTKEKTTGGAKIDVAKSAASFSFASLSSSLGSLTQNPDDVSTTTSPSETTQPLSSSQSTASVTNVTSVFGQGFSLKTSTAITTTDQTGKSVFGFAQPKTSALPAFGQTATVTQGTTSVFGETKKFSFGQPSSPSSLGFGLSDANKSPTFGQPVSGSTFGTTSSNSTSGSTSFFGHISQTGSIFGGSTSTSTPSVFGQPTSSPVGQGSSSSPFSQPTSSASGTLPFGQSGGFFSGLGGQPTPENANKNVFGSPSTFGQQSSMGSGGFGSSPAFGGGSPLFASSGSPKFGGSPTFGSGAAFSNPLGSVFGAPPQANAFGGQNQSPTFGALAQQSQTPTFGALAQQPQNTGFGSPTFGSPSPQGFSSPNQQTQTFGTTRPGGSAFTQWRN